MHTALRMRRREGESRFSGALLKHSELLPVSQDSASETSLESSVEHLSRMAYKAAVWQHSRASRSVPNTVLCWAQEASKEGHDQKSAQL